MLTRQQLLELAQQLPPLQFSVTEDCQPRSKGLIETYLNFYQINFAREFTGLSHGFGYVNVAEFRIATHYWLPKNAKGTLVINHGLYDHTGIYNHAIHFALTHNFAVLMFDLPGHGLSSGKPTAINSFDQYADVLAVILLNSKTLMPQPLHSVSQSTGGAVVLNYLWRYAFQDATRESFQKIVLCGPLILARGWGLRQIIYFVLKSFVKKINRSISYNSHDEHFIEFITTQDPLQAQYLMLSWIGAMKAWHQLFLTFTPQNTEVLIVQGTGDMTVNWRYNLPLIKRKLPNANICMIPDARHQLVNESETYRTQAFDAIEKYLNT